MEVPNKYRGERIYNGDVVYGELREINEYTALLVEGKSIEYNVWRDTLFKLVGYDRDGNEVYRSVE